MASNTSLRSYKGFDVCIVPRNAVHFGYEIRCHGGVAIRSPDAFVSRGAAFTAARGFIDEVDRRMGLRPSDGEGG